MEAPLRADLDTLPYAEGLNKIIGGLNTQVRGVEMLSAGVTLTLQGAATEP